MNDDQDQNSTDKGDLSISQTLEIALFMLNNVHAVAHNCESNNDEASLAQKRKTSEWFSSHQYPRMCKMIQITLTILHRVAFALNNRYVDAPSQSYRTSE